MTTMRSTIDEKDLDDFEIVKDYLMRCPHVSSARDSPAIKAALEGIEKEQQRRIRDAKLQCKFGGKRSASAVVGDYTDRDEIVVVDKDDIDVTTNARMMDTEEEDDDKEWQDVPHKDDGFSSGSNIDHSFELEGRSGGSSFLGKELAKACVDAIAEQQQRNNVVVSSPIAAIAVALHAALRSDILGFKTQNILPQKESSSKKGGLAFAAPIRELNKNQFLPYGWDDMRSSSSGNTNTNTTDKKNNTVSLRYRKMDMGAMILTVESVDEEGDCNDNNNIPGTTQKNVQVTLVPANSKEDSTPVHVLKFPIAEHINLDSWNAATLKAVGSKTSDKKECKIAPTLHYKNLSGLMSKFCRTFDLGTVSSTIDDADTLVTAPLGTTSYNDPILKQPTSDTHYPAVASVEHYPNRRLEGDRAVAPEWKEGRVPSTFDQAFPGRNPIYSGDFAGDILPAAGLHDPRFHTGRGNSEGQRMGGNLMGPNHPMFTPGGGGHGQMIGGGGVAFGGPGTMQPRFDPVYPPGVLDDDHLRHGPAGGRRLHNKKPSRSTTGEPNPDHLPPPNSLGGNGNNNHMFM